MIEALGINTLDELVAELRDRAKEREAVRRYEQKECRKLSILDREVEIETHYQVLPLLREVKREHLPRRSLKDAKGARLLKIGTPRMIKNTTVMAYSPCCEAWRCDAGKRNCAESKSLTKSIRSTKC